MKSFFPELSAAHLESCDRCQASLTNRSFKTLGAFFDIRGRTGFDRNVNRLVSMSEYDYLSSLSTGDQQLNWQHSFCHGSVRLGLIMSLCPTLEA